MYICMCVSYSSIAPFQDMQMEFAELSGYGDKLPPPASKKIVENLPVITDHKKGKAAGGGDGGSGGGGGILSFSYSH